MTAASPVEWAVAFCFGAIGLAILVFSLVQLVGVVRDWNGGGRW